MEDNSIVSIISRLGVDFSQAIVSAEQMAAKTNLVNASLERLQATSKITASTLAGTFTGAGAITAANQQAAATGKITNANKALTGSYVSVNDIAKDHIKTTQDLSRSYSMMNSQFLRHLSWFASGAAIFGGLALLKESLVDVERGMKGLTTVLPELHHSQEEYNEASRETIDLMQKFGADLDDTMTSARSFGRMYKDTTTVMGLTHNAILLNVIDMVQLEDAVKGNEAALSIYGKELQSTNEVLAFSGKLMDSLTRLSHESMAQASDLVQILQQSAGAAKNAKVELDQLLGLGASAVRATGLQGQGGNLGRMLRTVFTQLSAPTKAVEKDIEEVGVKMRDANGELRNAYDIILDLSLATKDASISQEELNQAINRASAGKFQYSKLSALVGSFDEIVKNTARSINAQGQTLQMAAQQLDTIDREARKLKATVIDLFSGVGDNGLRESLKDLIGGINQFVMGLNKVDYSVYEFGFKLLGAVIAIKTLTAVYNALLPITAMATLMTEGLTFVQAKQAVTTYGAAAALTVERTALIATTTATGAATTATNAFNAALIRNPIGLVITALTILAGIALTKYVSKMGEAEKATHDLNQEQRETLQLAQQQAMQMNTTVSYLETLKEKHNQLEKAIKSGELSTAELTEAQKNLQAVDEAILILADAKTRAIIKANGVTEKEIQLVLDSAVKSKNAAISKMQDQKGLTDKTIKETQKRIEALETENNLYIQMSKNIPKTLGITPTGKPSKGSFLNLEDKMAAKALEDENRKLDEQVQKSNELALAIITAKGEIEKLKHTSPDSTTDIPGGSSAASKNVDATAEALSRLADSAKQFGLVNMELEFSFVSTGYQLAKIDAEYEYLDTKMENGIITAQDYARMQELLAMKTALLKNEQMQLTNANQAYRQEIDSLTPLLAAATAEYERFKAAGDEEHTKDAADAVSSLKSEIDSLSGSIASNTQEIWANKGALDELTNAAYTSYYQQTMAWMQHMEAIGRMNDELEADILAGFDEQKMTLQDLWDLEEGQFNNRLDRLKEERDRIKDAYDERMEMYEAEIEANDHLIEQKEDQLDSAKSAIDGEIAAIRELMALLDEDAESEDREEAARQHNEKLAELAEERMYHDLRTGLEHQEAITDIDKQIDEEKRRWQLQQNDWARDDQKDAYQDQIDALEDKKSALEKSARQEIDHLKKTNDRKKQEMQKHYQEIESLLNDNNLRMLASVGSTNEQMYQKGLEMMRNLAQGIRDGRTENSSDLSDFMGDVSGTHGGIVSGGSSTRPSESDYTGGSGGKKLKSIVGPESYVNKGGRTYMWSQNLAGLLGETATWNQADGTVTIGGKKFTPAWNNNGRTFLGIREVAEALGYSTTYDDKSQAVSIWDKAHTGAKVKTTGIAELMHDERVLSPQLTVSFEKLAAVLSRPTAQAQISSMGSSADFEKIADRVIAAIERKQGMQIDKLLNIEHAGFENKYDGQSLGVDIRNVLTATGGR